MMKSLQSIISLLDSREIKDRFQGVLQLNEYIKKNTILQEEVTFILNSLSECLNENNFKVCDGALAALRSLMDQVDKGFKPYITMVIPFIITRMGDGKSVVRQRALECVLSICKITSPKDTFAVLEECFTHKSWRVRESILYAFLKIVDEFGPKSLSFYKLLTPIVNLLGDPNSQVRDAAIMCIQKMYRYVGDEIKYELEKRHLREAQMREIMEKLSTEVVDTTQRVSLKEKSKGSPKNAKQQKGKKTGIGGYTKEIISDSGPIPCSSEQELQAQMEDIVNALQDNKDADWTQKMFAMKKLQGLAHGDAIKFSNFIPLLHGVKEHLAKILSDLRSTLVKQTCICIADLSQVMGDSFEPFADYFIPFLLKTTFVTIKVISTSGNECIRTIIQNCKVNKGLIAICESLTSSKNGSLRARCAEYLLLILELSKSSHLEKYSQMICKTVQKCLSDSQPEARATGRKCYWALQKLWPDRAESIFTHLDFATQKSLKFDTQNRPKIKSSLPPRRERIPLRRSKSATQSPEDKKLKWQYYRPASSGSSPDNKSLFSSTWHGTEASSDRVQSILEAANAKLSRKSIETGLESRSHPSSLSSSFSSVDSSHSKHSDDTPLNRQQKQLSRAERLEQKIRMVVSNKHGGAQRVPVETFSGHKTYPMERYHKLDVSKLRPPSAEKRYDPSIYEERFANEKPIVEKRPSSSHGVDITKILREANSPDWNIRISVFTKLQELLDNKSSEITSSFKRVMPVVIERLNDSHYRVVQEALTVLIKMISMYQNQIEQYLELIFPVIFTKLTAPQAPIKNLASSALETFAENFSGDTLLPVLLKVVDAPNAKIRLGCIEFILHIIPQSRTYLSTPSHMRSCIMKLENLISQRKTSSQDCRRAYIAGLMSLYKVDPDLFLSQLLLLPMTEQLNIKKILSKQIPDLNGELTAISKLKHPKSAEKKRPRSVGPIEKVEPKPEPTPEKKRYTVDSPYSLKSNSTLQNAEPTNDVPTDLLSKLKHTNAVYSDHTAFNEISKLSPADEIKALPDMLDKLPKADTMIKREYCRRINRLVKEKNEELWSTYFVKTLFAVLEILYDKEEKVREDSLVLLTSMLEHHISYFADFAELTLKRILERYDDESKAVGAAAEEAALMYIEKMEPMKVLEILRPIIMDSTKESILLGGIRLLSKLVHKLPPTYLLQHVPRVLPGLFEAFKHPNVDIRKSVVYCLVDMYTVLGDNFKPYLAKLNTSQLKLVAIYLQKQKSEKQ